MAHGRWRHRRGRGPRRDTGRGGSAFGRLRRRNQRLREWRPRGQRGRARSRRERRRHDSARAEASAARRKRGWHTRSRGRASGGARHDADRPRHDADWAWHDAHWGWWYRSCRLRCRGGAGVLLVTHRDSRAWLETVLERIGRRTNSALRCERGGECGCGTTPSGRATVSGSSISLPAPRGNLTFTVSRFDASDSRLRLALVGVARAGLRRRAIHYGGSR